MKRFTDKLLDRGYFSAGNSGADKAYMTLVELFDKWDEDQRLFAAIFPGWLKAFEIGARDEIIIAKSVWHGLESDEENPLGLSEFQGIKFQEIKHSKFAQRPCVKVTSAQAYLNSLIEAGVTIDEIAFEMEAPVWLVEAAVQGLSEAFNEPYWEQINDTTRADIFTSLTRMIDEGQSVRNTAAQIMAASANYSRARAMNVARTEMTNAMNAGHVAGIRQIQEESGLAMSKEWLSVLGTTTRDTHADADGQEVPVDDEFTVGDYRASRPGHQSLPAKERCNCQCSVISGFVTDAIPSGADEMEEEELIPEPPPLPPPPTQTPAQVPAPEPATDPVIPKPVPKKRNVIPSAAELTDVGPAGGSTGARIMEDAEGNRYVVKRGSSPDHLREEVLADRLYKTLGADVPEAKFELGDDGQPVKITRFLEGAKPYNELTPEEKKVVDRKIQKRFAADALMGNWDVMGLDNDNILVDSKGNPWRIDNGGSLRYRAQGQRKGDAFADQALDLWTLKDPNVNARSAAVFGDVSHDAMVRQSTAILKKRDKIMKDIEKLGVEMYGERQYELEDKMRARLDSMQRVVDTSLDFKKSDFNEKYRDDITRHREQLINHGVFDGKSESLERKKGKGVEVFDENGKAWNGLRGRGSVTEKFADYVNTDIHDNAYGALEKYFAGQAGDSFSEASLARKQALFDSMDKKVKWDEFYWNGETKKKVKKSFENQADNLDGAKRGLSADDALKEAYASHHAMTYHMLQTTEFERNNQKNNTVALGRTEARGIIEGAYGVKEGEAKVIKRGMAESFSLYEQVVVHAKDPVLMVQEVPHAQIYGSYFSERGPGSGKSLYMGDAENEFVAMTRNVKTRNLGKAKRSAAIPNPEDWDK